MTAQTTGDIRKIKKVDPQSVSDSVAKVTDAIRVIRLRDRQLLDSLSAAEKMDLLGQDILLIPSLWRTHLRLEFDSGNRGRVTLAPEILTKEGQQTLFGAGPGPRGGRYSLFRDDQQIRVEVHSGGIIIKDWKANRAESICVRAAEATVCNWETTYAVHQDSSGMAGLFVEAGEVQITKDDGTTQTALPGESYRWSATTPIELIAMNDDEATILAAAVDYTGDDLWNNFREELLLIPAAAVIICLVTDIWFCGGGDATGNVIVTP